MNEFLQQHDEPGQPLAQPLSMEQMRREGEVFVKVDSPEWVTQYNSEQLRVGPEFEDLKVGAIFPSRFSPAEFQTYQQLERRASPRVMAPMSHSPPTILSYRRSIRMARPLNRMTYSFIRPTSVPRVAESDLLGKGKGKLVELDNKNWEQEFAEIESAGSQDVDAEANAAIEAELDHIDKSATPATYSLKTIRHLKTMLTVDTQLSDNC